MRKRPKYYKLKEKQIANIVLAARNKSGCAKAKNFVKKLDKKYRLKKKI